VRALLFGLGLLAGCGGGPGGTDGAELPDLSAPPDLTPPAPQHVGVTGVTCCLVTHPSGRALYLADVDPMQGTGTLHLYDGANDHTLGVQVPCKGYELSPDGKFAFFTSPGQWNQKLSACDTSSFAVTTILPGGLAADPLAAGKPGFDAPSFFSPSGKYLIVGARAQDVGNSRDLYAIDTATARIAASYGNGAYEYRQVVAADDTMYFQNSVGGTMIGDPAVQTLFRVSLPAAASGAQPAKIDIHSSSLALTPDGKTLVYNKVDGSLWSYDVAMQKVAQLAPTGVSFSVGALAAGPVAYLAADRSVHVESGGAALYDSPAAQADLFTPLSISRDGMHLFFFQKVDVQGNHGDLWHVALPPAADNRPELVAMNAALTQINVAGGRIVFEGNVDASGFTGDVTGADLDGSGAVTLAEGALTRELLIAQPGGNTLIASLSGAVSDAAMRYFPVDKSQANRGALAVGASSSTRARVVDDNVHSGVFEFSDDGRLLVFAGGATWSDTASNYVGGLHVMDATTATAGPTLLGGVSELGTVAKRTLYVNAPAADPPGVYLVRY
jgi:hypothetical protein